ncbi:hypothetical protein KVV02_006637 [Mortierella alpina]|uniref:Uncharacterized protein n=1 Tax=Mortierella alpina TaxID=64518 RepID=A0A9P7ZZV4_MORAP|nr:hypothetical protein KVV02_006637 [Mortierella alpina]
MATFTASVSAIPEPQSSTSNNNHEEPYSVPDIHTILASESAMLNPSMTKEQVLAIGHHLTRGNAHLTRLVLDERFKDLQDAIKEFLSLPCCSKLQSLDYKAGGSSFAQIILSSSAVDSEAAVPITSDQLRDKQFVHDRVPFASTLTSLRLGYNSDAPQGETDIQVFNALLKHMPQLQEFSMTQSLNDLALFESLGDSSSSLRKVSVTINTQCGMEQQQVEDKMHEAGYLPGIQDLEIDLDDRESSYYLNQSRDRHFQAFMRRFGGERKNA